MAKISHRVGYDLLADDVKSIMNSGLNIFDVSNEYILENANPDLYDYVKVMNGVNKNRIYMWTDSGFKFIGEYEHTHTKSQIVDFAHNHDEYVTKQQIIDEHYTKIEIDNKLYTKADKELKIGTDKPFDDNMWYKEI